MTRLALVALATLALSALPASAGNPNGGGNLVMGYSTYATSEIVEQQSPNFFFNNCGGNPSNEACDPSLWVRNFGECMWDADDRRIGGGEGNLAAGARAEIRPCIIADWYQHSTGFLVRSPSNDLIVEISYLPQNVTFRLQPYAVGHGFEYRGCVRGPYYSGSNLQPIEGSNGGVGVEGEVTLSIENPTSRTVRKTYGQFNLGQQNGPGNLRSTYCSETFTRLFEAGASFDHALN